MNFFDRLLVASTAVGGILLLAVIEVSPLAAEAYEILERKDNQEHSSELLEDTDPSADDVVPYTAPRASVQDTPVDPSPVGYGWTEVLNAIRVVETGGEPDGGSGAVGDLDAAQGVSKGPYQISEGYWIDAVEQLAWAGTPSTITWSDCLDSRDQSEIIMRSYMRRFARSAASRLDAGTATIADVEKVARIHNGGPNGLMKSATRHYWAKVQGSIR